MRRHRHQLVLIEQVAPFGLLKAFLDVSRDRILFFFSQLFPVSILRFKRLAKHVLSVMISTSFQAPLD